MSLRTGYPAWEGHEAPGGTWKAAFATITSGGTWEAGVHDIATQAPVDARARPSLMMIRHGMMI